jgi:hypothetical protein
MFSDLVGSTALAARMDPEDLPSDATPHRRGHQPVFLLVLCSADAGGKDC